MASLLTTISSYLPTLSLQRWQTNMAPLDAPEAESFPAALLFADISGFTALTERLAQRGPAGAEELIRVLNEYFGELIDLVYSHGGDIVKFAGDALLAVWPDRGDSEDASTRTLRAAQCAISMQAALSDHVPREGTRLSLKVGIGEGPVSMSHIGGIGGHWELLVTGLPLVQIGQASHEAKPGDVILTPLAWELVRDHCAGDPLPSGGVLLSSMNEGLLPRSTPELHLPPEAESPLMAHVPMAIRSRLMVGQTEWLAELRQLTVLFVNLPDLTHETPLDRSQTIMAALQEELGRFEGSINKLSVDEKGVSLLAAMGLPPLAHEDDAIRGTKAAMAIHERLTSLGFRSSIGVCTGKVFCGEVGNPKRREYTTIGDTVNLAARLMQAAAGGILCDVSTFQAAAERIRFETLPSIVAKGKTGSLAVFRPMASIDKVALTTTTMVGRIKERQLFAERLFGLQNAKKSACLVVEAEAGMGKSRLIADFRLQAQAQDLTIWTGAGDAIDKSTPYHAWRPVFSQLFKLETVDDDPESRRRHVLAQLEKDPWALSLAPLLNPILLLDLPQTDMTRQMSGQVRADNTRELLSRLLQRATVRGPALLVIEDAHWMDSASWAFALVVSQQVHPLMLVISMRPLSDPLPNQLLQLLSGKDTEEMHLDALAPEEALSLVCQRLGVDSLPDPVAELIREKAEGHPFFSEEVAYALRDAGLIVIEDGKCHMSSKGEDFHALNLPNTVEGVITSRIDRLEPSLQLTLKVASVIGRVFAYRTIRDIYPIDSERGHLPECLNILETLDLLPVEAREPDLTYIFKHMITQEVVYNLMLYSQRQQLHRAVAEWYERTYAEDLSALYPILAYHWTKAADTERAVTYLEVAGDQALKNFANQEALRFFTEAISVCEQAGVKQDPKRTARWAQQMGKACLGLGRLAESQQHLKRALALYKEPVPETRGELLKALLGQVVRQLWHRFLPYRRAPESQSTDYFRRVRIYENLAQIHYWANDSVNVLFAMINCLNLSEQLPLSPELARSYANMALACGLIPLHGPAKAYGKRALEVSEAAQDQLTHASALIRIGLYELGIGHLGQACTSFEQSLAICDRLGDRRQWAESLSTLAVSTFLRGDFKQSARLYAEQYTRGVRSGDVQQQFWALNGGAMCDLGLGDFAEAQEKLTKASPLLVPTDSVGTINFHGRVAVVYLRQGELEKAWHALEVSFQRLTQKPALLALVGFSSTADACFSLLEIESLPASLDRALVLSRAQAIVKGFGKFARTYPIARTHAHRWQGLVAWNQGKSSQARRAWQKSLAEAEQLNMPYEMALAHYEIGRHLPAGDAHRQQHLSIALGIFGDLGASFDVQRTEGLLEGAR